MAHIDISLTVKIFLGVLFGILVGIAINILGLNTEGGFINTYITNGVFLIIGEMFITALKVVVIPLVLFSLISGVIAIGDLKELSKIGSKTFLLSLFTTTIAVTIAIILAASLKIGVSANLTSYIALNGNNTTSLSSIFINIVPSNIINAMSKGNMLQVIFFGILLGISILMVGKKAKPIIELVDIVNEIMMKIVNIIIAISPYAIFALLARSMANLGLELLSNLAVYVIVLIAALLIHLYITLMFILRSFTQKSPKMFLKKIREAQIFAFATSSSNATIAITLRAATKKLGVHSSIASFTIPFGSTVNMDATAIMQAVATIFIANAYGIELGFFSYITVVLFSVLASIATAGVPGAGVVMLSIIFTQIGLPIEGIGLILGVDRVLDMIRTAVNVSSDAAISVIVAKSEGKLNEALFNDPNAGKLKQNHIKINNTAKDELAYSI